MLPRWFSKLKGTIGGRHSKEEPYATVRREEHDLTEPDRDASYSPFWTRKIVLVCFLVCFIVLLAALEIIKKLSESERGLAQIATRQNWYYAWTYGPTAILTIFLALWNRVDFRMRQMTPWKDLSPVDLSPQQDKLFFEYVSPTVPEILWHSARRKHFSVFASSLVSILTTLLIVISTGLLTPTERLVRSWGTQYKITTTFIDDAGETLPRDSTLPLDTIDAIDVAGLAYPLGTRPDTNYQIFDTIDAGVDGKEDLELNVTTIDITCDPASIVVYNWTNQWTCPVTPTWPYGLYQTNIAVQSGNCTMPVDIATSSFTGDDGTTGNFAFFQTGYCDTGPPEYNHDARLAIGLGRAVQHGSMGPKPTIVNDDSSYNDSIGCNDSYPIVNVELLESSQWICKTRVGMVRAEILANASGIVSGQLPTIVVLPDAAEYPMSIEGSNALVDGVSQLLYYTTYNDEHPSELFYSLNLILTPHDPSTGGRTWDNQYAAFVRLLRHAPANTTFEDLAGTDLLVQLTQTWWRRMYVQLINSFYTVSLNDTVIEGSTWVTRDFLTVRNVPLRLMEALLGMNIVLTIYLLTSHYGSIPYDPARLVGLVLLLRSQSKVRMTLRDTGNLSISDLRQKLEAKSKGVARKPLAAEVKSREVSQKWWQPLPLRTVSRVCVAVLVLVIIIVLQVLLALSKKRQGLADVNSTGEMHLAWSTVPAFTMVIVAMYVKSFGSCYKSFWPYYKLRRNAPPQALFSNYLTATEVEVFGAALKRREWVIALVASAIIFSSTLTIIVSGVWTAGPVVATRKQNVTPQSFFTDNYSGIDAGNAGANAFVSGLIVALNLSYPKWTHGDLAFASYNLDKDISDQRSTMQVELPAIRAALNCTFYPQNEIPELTWDTHTQYSMGNGVTPAIAMFKMPGPEHCRGNSSQFEIVGGYTLDERGIVLKGGVFLENDLPNCPQLNYFWGGLETYNRNASSTDNTTYWQGLSCYESIEQVRVDTTLTADLNITTSSPPQVIADSAWFFSDTNVSIPYDHLPVLVTEGTNDNGFWAIVQYKYGADLISNFASTEQRDKIIDAVKTTHGIIRAQQYHAEMRSSDAAVLSDIPSILTATISDPQRYRLLQNTISTHILCGLLAAILILTALASWLMNTKNVLPKNPHSIAAQISMLADSNIFADKELLDSLEATVRNRETMKQRLADCVFRMGWFENGVQGYRVFTINVLEAVSMTEGSGDDELVDFSVESESAPKPQEGVSETEADAEAEYLVQGRQSL